MKNYLIELFGNLSIKIEEIKEIDLIFSIPNDTTHGDYSTNLAMLLTKKMGKKPRDIAQEIIDNLEYDNNIIDKIEIAGPGFINFYFNKNYLTKIVEIISKEKDNYGKSNKYNGQKALVEFVSANPTGPLTVGHGRNAVVGDTLANILSWVGYQVEREYYFNNAGRQMRVLGDSLRLRYLQLFDNSIEFPDDYYQGEYIIDISKNLKEENGDKYINEPAEGIFKDVAEKEIFNDIKQTLSSLNIVFDSYFNENNLYTEGKIEEVISKLKDKNLIYEQDNALWFKLTELGQEQDKVIVKSSGEPTYRLPDIAYHMTKFDRKYDLMVDLFGSDHNATYPDVLAGLKALDYETDKVKVVIHQFVTIMDKGEIVKMSTRKANFITLDELVDDVGVDVVRYFFNMRSVTTHLNFDLDLAKKHSEENPVFYLQYAHARICSIIRMSENEKLSVAYENLNLLVAEEEQALLKKLYEFNSTIIYAAENFETQKITNYLEELAGHFHRFYNHCRIIGTEKNLAEARLSLINSVKIVLSNGLKILGLSAPEKM